LDVEVAPVRRDAPREVVRLADIGQELRRIPREKARDIAEQGLEIDVRRRLQDALPRRPDFRPIRRIAAAKGSVVSRPHPAQAQRSKNVQVLQYLMVALKFSER
jgi:hypothetical protein